VYGRTAVTDFHHVAEEYDRIGPEYQESKLLPFRLHVEEHTTFGLLPDLAGLSVVDLACGDGIYARKLRRRGAARVVGVDISPEMVSLARRAEEAAPIGVEYVLADVANVDLGERFDIAFCSFLFNYATSRGELRALIESVARLVRPGGLVVGCNDYPATPMKAAPSPTGSSIPTAPGSNSTTTTSRPTPTGTSSPPPASRRSIGSCPRYPPKAGPPSLPASGTPTSRRRPW
jgi:ubiquinone/menaquinone biosynthesis C-methylase UbiE